MAELTNQNAVAENVMGKLQSGAMQGFGALPQINPADPLGNRPNQYADYQEQLQEIYKQLEDRYSQPNWFDVAAGFAKPQLGGFMAGFGSASEALAKNVEQRRAQGLPLSQLKLEMYKNQQLQNQAVDAKTIYEGAMIKNGYVPEKEVGDIISLVGKEHPIAQGALANREGRYAEIESQSGQAGTQLKLGEALAKNPYLVVNTSLFKAGAQTPEEQKKLANLLDKAMPPQTHPDQWKAMGIEEKKDLVATYADAQLKQGMTEEQASLHDARGAVDRLKILRHVRELAADPDMAPVFSVLNNADAVSLFKKITDQAGGNLGAVMEGLKNAIRSQYTNEDDPTGLKRQKADELFKSIAQMAVQNRNNALNPTNAYQTLVDQATPGLDNSQKGFLSIVDQMGLREQQLIDEHNLRIDSGLDARHVFDDPRVRALRKKYDEESRELAKSDAYTRTPSWLDNVQVTIPPGTSRPPETKPEAKPEKQTDKPPSSGASSGSPKSRPTERMIGGVPYVLENGAWVRKD